MGDWRLRIRGRTRPLCCVRCSLDNEPAWLSTQPLRSSSFRFRFSSYLLQGHLGHIYVLALPVAGAGPSLEVLMADSFTAAVDRDYVCDSALTLTAGLALITGLLWLGVLVQEEQTSQP